MSDDTPTQAVVLPLVNQPIIQVQAPKVAIALVEYPTFSHTLSRAANICVDYAHADVHEVGGNNNGEQVGHFQSITGNHNGESWCASCACMCLVKSLAQLMGWPEDEARLLSYVGLFGKLYMPVSGYCPTLWKEAEARGWFHPRNDKKGKLYMPKGPCIVLYDFNTEGEPHHVGFWLQYDSDEETHKVLRVKDVSGNTGPGPGVPHAQQDGDGVYVNHRPTTRIFGFIEQ